MAVGGHLGFLKITFVVVSAGLRGFGVVKILCCVLCVRVSARYNQKLGQFQHWSIITVD